MLYLAATRGARGSGGVPALAVWINFLTCYLGYMLIGSADFTSFAGYVWIFLGFLIHWGMRALVERDPNIFRILQTMFRTFVVSRHQVMWAAPWRFPRTAKAMISAL